MTESKLRFTTIALRRVMASEHHEVSPVVMPGVVSYGTEDRTAMELGLALSELPNETRPATVARLLLPDGVRLETIALELGRPRSEERRVGKECYALCRSRWSPYH